MRIGGIGYPVSPAHHWFQSPATPMMCPEPCLACPSHRFRSVVVLPLGTAIRSSAGLWRWWVALCALPSLGVTRHTSTQPKPARGAAPARRLPIPVHGTAAGHQAAACWQGQPGRWAGWKGLAEGVGERGGRDCLKTCTFSGSPSCGHQASTRCAAGWRGSRPYFPAFQHHHMSNERSAGSSTLLFAAWAFFLSSGAPAAVPLWVLCKCHTSSALHVW